MEVTPEPMVTLVRLLQLRTRRSNAPLFGTVTPLPMVTLDKTMQESNAHPRWW